MRTATQALIKSALSIYVPVTLALLLVGGVLGLAATPGEDNLTRLTTASDPDRDSFISGLNADGTRMVFQSDSDFLGEGVPDEQYEIWLYDTATMTFTRITIASGNDRDSWNPDLNADGTRVVFRSDNDFLGEGISDEQYEVWLYDIATFTLTRLTSASDSDRDSLAAKINGDGTKVVFQSDSDFLSQGIPNDQDEIWLYDTAAMTLTRLTTASDSDRDSRNPQISTDGTKVAFRSDSDFLGQGILAGRDEVWLLDTTTLSITRLTIASDPSRNSIPSSLSADGTKVVFQSDSDLLGQGIPDEQIEIWLYDTATLTLTRLTMASDSDRDSRTGTISADGTKVVFTSDSDFHGQGIPDGQSEIWLYDITTLTLTRLTTASHSDRLSAGPFVNTDGTKVVFYSDSDFLGEGIPNDQFEIWLESLPSPVYLPIIIKPVP